MKVAFFQCSSCKTWRYSSKPLDYTRKYKCLKCGRMINLDAVVKEIYNMPNRIHLKVKVLKEIKMRGKKL